MGTMSTQSKQHPAVDGACTAEWRREAGHTAAELVAEVAADRWGTMSPSV